MHALPSHNNIRISTPQKFWGPPLPPRTMLYSTGQSVGFKTCQRVGVTLQESAPNSPGTIFDLTKCGIFKSCSRVPKLCVGWWMSNPVNQVEMEARTPICMSQKSYKIFVPVEIANINKTSLCFIFSKH